MVKLEAAILCALALAIQGASVHDSRFRRGADDYAAWSRWGQCSASCGLGTKTRSRGDETEQKSCTKGPCVVWAAWGSWLACSATCGEGTRRRTRHCPNYFGCASDRTKIMEESTQSEACVEAPCAGGWGSWGAWGACSAFCDGGNQSRSRTCSSYGACDGPETESKACNTHSCCTPWGDWGQCSVTCAADPEAGVEARKRRCVVTIPGTGGQYASKTESEERPCSPREPCAEWSSWESWGTCSEPCGPGERVRGRECSVPGACEGEDEDAEVCNEGECAEWRSWTRWTTCSKTCGGGTRNRQRTCSQGEACSGPSSEEEPCNEALACPGWTEWAPWGYCSEECGGGWQVRTRVCNQYNLCPGDKKEKRLCNTHNCPEVGPWGEWGECSAPCGGGFAMRTRECLTDAEFCGQEENEDSAACFCEANLEDSQACNGHRCAEIGSWSGWGSCSVDCGGGEMTRTRECRNDASFCVGANRLHESCLCEGQTFTESDSCNTLICPAWSTWQEWGDCSLPCGGGARERKRVCERDDTYCSDKADDHPACLCPGLDHSNEQCNAHRCPSWARWGRWGDCSADCEGGVRSRTRNCRNDAGFCDGPDANPESCECEGEGELEEECNSHQCAAWVKWNHWSPCSTTCGSGGVQTRDRTCNKDFGYCFGGRLTSDPSCQCEGTPDEEQPCNEAACPSWSSWGDYGACSASCEGGKQVRTRECTTDDAFCGANPDAEACTCEGGDTDEMDCNSQPCAIWSSWEPWNSCSVVCGGGSRTRARQCPTEGGCEGLGEETDFCNQLPCPDWGSWAPWADCTASCGGGQMFRTRTCPIAGGCSPGEALNVETCNPEECPMWTRWNDWGQCTVTCGEGVRIRTRDCPTGTGSGCPGKPEDEEICLEQTCQQNTFWSEWSPCTQTCGSGVQVRSRLETLAGPLLEETQDCETQACPQWGTWEQWSDCTVTCGSGQRERMRQCQDAATGDEVPRGCVGSVKQIDPQACNAISC